MHHYLRPLLAPASLALVGASERTGSLGRVVLENVVAGGYTGTFHAVNPAHRTLLGQRSWPSVAAIGAPVELVVIAVPCDAVPGVIDDAARARAKAAVLLTAAPADSATDAKRWARDVGALAAKRGIRLVGPGAFGLVRTDIGLNASVSDAEVLPRAPRAGRAVGRGVHRDARLRARRCGIGFSTVVSLGGVARRRRRRAARLAARATRDTDGILLYVEQVGDARRFLSALRAAARTKPVVAAEGRSLARARATRAAVARRGLRRRDAPLRHRARAHLHATLRRGAHARDRQHSARRPHRDRRERTRPRAARRRRARDAGIELAALVHASTIARARRPDPGRERARQSASTCARDATPERFAARRRRRARRSHGRRGRRAARAAAVVDPPTDAARAVAAVASRVARSRCWPRGSVRSSVPRRARRWRRAGIANFYTPENAVEAFAFLASYRRHQELLLEVPPPTPEPEAPDQAALERLREAIGARDTLDAEALAALLAAFHLPVPALARATTLAGARAAARRLGYPVTLAVDAPLRASSMRGPLVVSSATTRSRPIINTRTSRTPTPSASAACTSSSATPT